MAEPQIPDEEPLDPAALDRRAASARSRAEERSAEEAHARRLAERYRHRVPRHESFPDRSGAVPVDSGRPDAALRVRAVSPRRQGHRHRRVRSDRPADDRRAARAARDPGPRDGRRALGDRVDPQEERKLAAGARRGHRRVPDPAAQGRRRRRGQPHGRAPDERHQPDHPAGRLDDLHGDPAPRQRHPRRDAGRWRLREVPDRRRAAAGDAADRQALPQLDHLAHQGDGRARHRREARASGRPLQAARAGQDDRLPRLRHAERARRGLGHPYSRQAVDQRTVHRAAAGDPRVSRARSCGGSASTSASRTAWCW